MVKPTLYVKLSARVVEGTERLAGLAGWLLSMCHPYEDGTQILDYMM